MRTVQGQKPLTLQGQWTPRQWTPLDAVVSCHPGVVPVQHNYRALRKRIEAAPVQRKDLPSGFTAAPATADATRLVPIAFQMALHGNSPPWAVMAPCSVPVSPRPHGQCDAVPCRRASFPSVVCEQSFDDASCTERQQKTNSRVSRCSSRASTTASTICSPTVVFRDVRMDLETQPLVAVSQQTTDSVSRCSSEASTEDPDALHLHTDSLRIHNKFLALQLQQQQKMVKLLLKQLEKEQERRHRMEDALLERRS